MKKRLKRLQGREWYELKDQLTCIKVIKVTPEGNVKILLKDKEGTKYVHWLSDKEKETMEIYTDDEPKCCMNCANCIPIGEGDHLCDSLMTMVLEDYTPTDEYYGCGGSEYERL